MSTKTQTKSDSWISNIQDAQRMRDMLSIQIVFMAGLIANIDSEISDDDSAHIQSTDILREIMNKLQNPAEVVQ